MGNRLPTVTQLKKECRNRQDMGMSMDEAFEDVVGDLLSMCKQYQRAAKSRERDHERLKAKLRPLIKDPA